MDSSSGVSRLNSANLCSYLSQRASIMWGMSEVPRDFKYAGMEDFVLDRGTAFKSQRLTESEMDIVFDAIKDSEVKCRQKECFYNAQILATTDKTQSLQYVEGFACGRGLIPVAHAWLSLNGKVVDVTWAPDEHEDATFNRVLGEFPEGWVYMGVPMDLDVVKMQIVDKRECSSIILDYQNQFPLLRIQRKNPKPTPFVFPES